MFTLTADWMSMLVVGFATLFLIGEVLVNARGIFAILGIGFITIFFSSFLDTGMFFIMILVYIIGILFIVIDGKLLNDGTLSVIGLAMMIFSVGLAAPNWISGLYAVIGIFIGSVLSFTFLKVFKRRSMWQKITLFDKLTEEAGYSSINESYRELIGETGITVTDMRPIGTVRINDKEYSAITQGKWLVKDTEIVVEQVDGTKIQVKELEN
ncbi:membrane-bound ClpP family serine protease [Gracilibacillus halotolerans]|uniref:Membrane-bound ClpP family serine protease n=1 Tax=Gracilibacillus halotolerans TaxID=74386 RepID=A0A841RGN7_9BACI|nr:NfeD family protein [Gracilibacillus halotolerans]MBB6511801.1 membrane-bound ClpP family serine protease [Gracilibacillus halotolerans]